MPVFSRTPVHLACMLFYFVINQFRTIENKRISKNAPFYAVNPACKHNAGNPDGKYLLNYRIRTLLFKLVLVFLPETLNTIGQRD